MPTNSENPWGLDNADTYGSNDDDLLEELFGVDEDPDGDPNDMEEIKEDEDSGKSKKNKKPKSKQAEDASDDDPFLPKNNDAEDDIFDVMSDDESNTEDNEEERDEEATNEKKKEIDDEEEGDENSDDQEGEEEKDDQENNYNALAKDLIKLGVFEENEDNEDPNTPEEFLERFEQEANKKAQKSLSAYLGRFGQDRVQLFDAIFNKNVDPKEYLQAYSDVQKLSDLDLSKEKNQEKVVRKSLANQGFDAEDIDSEVDRLKEYGDLEDTSKKFHKALVKFENKELQKAEQKAEEELYAKQQREQQRILNINSTIEQGLKDREIEGLSITPKIAQEVNQFLTVPAYQMNDEKYTEFDKFMMEAKQNVPLQVKLALLYRKGFDLSKVNLKKKSKKSDELFESLSRQKKRGTKKTKNTANPGSKGNSFFDVWGG